MKGVVLLLVRTEIYSYISESVKRNFHDVSVTRTSLSCVIGSHELLETPDLHGISELREIDDVPLMNGDAD